VRVLGVLGRKRELELERYIRLLPYKRNLKSTIKSIKSRKMEALRYFE
jgi:hypothetical protein